MRRSLRHGLLAALALGPTLRGHDGPRPVNQHALEHENPGARTGQVA